MFHRRPADAALTRTHSASRLQFGVGPSRVALQAAKLDIFAAADDGVLMRKRAQLLAQDKCLFEADAEAALLGCASLQRRGAAAGAGAGVAAFGSAAGAVAAGGAPALAWTSFP